MLIVYLKANITFTCFRRFFKEVKNSKNSVVFRGIFFVDKLVTDTPIEQFLTYNKPRHYENFVLNVNDS